MVQRHSIILWKKAEREERSFEEIAKEAYEVLSILQNYPLMLRPNYLTGKSLGQTEVFEWNMQNFYTKLESGINKEGGILFYDLGYSVSFFSSKNKEEACSIEMTVGNRNEKLYNTIIINLPISFDVYEKKNGKMIGELFESMTKIYKPFWGCVSNKSLSRRYGKFLQGNIPTTIHWINYWSEDIINVIGREKINKIVESNPEILFKKHILSIKDTAIDVDKEEDIIFQNELQKKFFDKKDI